MRARNQGVKLKRSVDTHWKERRHEIDAIAQRENVAGVVPGVSGGRLLPERARFVEVPGARLGACRRREIETILDSDVRDPRVVENGNLGAKRGALRPGGGTRPGGADKARER